MIELYITHHQKGEEHNTAKLLAEKGLYDTFGIKGSLCHRENGKPYFSGAENIFVSISHSKGLCIAALSDREIGADTEAFTEEDTERLLRLAKRYFTADEYSYTEVMPQRRFFEIWCGKESYMKYTGKGLSEGLSSFSVLNRKGIEFPVVFSGFTYKNHMIVLCSEEQWPCEPKYIEIT